MMSPVARVKSIKTKSHFQLSYQRHLKPSFIKLTKSEVVSVQIPVPKWEKTKKQENFFWATKRGNKMITNRGRFQGLKIGARGITNRGSLRDFKSGQKDYKLGQKDFKSGQGLQIDTEQLSILFKFSSDNKLSSDIAIF